MNGNGANGALPRVSVRIELTHRLAELAGYRDRPIDLAAGATLRDALSVVESSLAGNGGAALVPGGRLHPSVLVVVDGRSQSRGCSCPLSGGETIHLMLPVAGG